MNSHRPPPVFFDEALRRAVAFVQIHRGQLGEAPLLVRDIEGRIRVALDDRPPAPPVDPAALVPLAAALADQLGVYSPGNGLDDVFLFGRHLLGPDALFADREIQPLVDHPPLRLLERQLVGHDWLRPPLQLPAQAAPRATLYGVKGGVGRSTALSIWALHLAATGRRVLVVDLDLESPGVGSMLLPEQQLPRYGLVDYFVEDQVDQGEALIGQIHRMSPLASRGEIVVVPAAGARLQGDAPDDYLAKLARVYLGKPQSDEGFAARIESVLERLEQQLRPDVVLLDSRAGLHDIAAVTITRLNALALLFAVNTPQTLAAYRLLFRGFHARPRLLAGFRDRLQVVAAQVPETDRERYLTTFKERMHQLFAEHLYEEEGELPVAAEEEPAPIEVFNYSVDDEEAPHWPVPIYWYRWFQDLDLAGSQDLIQTGETQAAFGPFCERATALLELARTA